MGISVIQRLAVRLHQIAFAGSTIHISEDFRLRRAIQELEKLATSNLVLTKIYEQSRALINGDIAKEELFDLIALINAVQIVTTSEMIEGEVIPIKSQIPQEAVFKEDGSCRWQYAYSKLMPLYRVFTKKGAWRDEIVRKAYFKQVSEKSGVLHDIRLQKPIIQAISNKKSDRVPLIQMILLSLGEKVVPALKQDFDLEGNQEMVWQLEVIEAIAGAKENDFYCMVAEKGKDRVRQRAIYALRLDKKNVSTLLKLAESEKDNFQFSGFSISGAPYRLTQLNNVKRTILSALGQIEDERVNAYFKDYVKEHREAVAQYLIYNDSKDISDAAAEWIEKLTDLTKQMETKVLTEKQQVLVQTALADMVNKTSPRMLQALENFSVENLEDLKEKERTPFWFTYTNICYASNVVRNAKDQFIFQLAHTAVLTKNQAYRKFIQNMLQKQRLEYLPAVLIMSFIYEPERAYEFVKPYLTPEHKKECCSMVYIALSFLYYNSAQHVYYLKCELPIESGFQSYAMTINSLIGDKIEEKKTLNLRLDLRLVELILDEKKEFTILDRLFDKGNEELFPLYQSHYKKMADKGENYVYLKGLQKCGNTNWEGIFCSYMKNHSGHLYSHILGIYMQLPIKIEEKIEELKQALKIIEEKKANSELYYYALDSSLKQEIKDDITKLEKKNRMKERKCYGDTNYRRVEKSAASLCNRRNGSFTAGFSFKADSGTVGKAGSSQSDI